MRDEAEVVFSALNNVWGEMSREEIVARAFSLGMTHGWNMRNLNSEDMHSTFEEAEEKMRQKMTSGKSTKVRI